MRIASLVAALCAFALFASGCGQTAKTYPIPGKVTLPGGKPLAGALVEFQTTLPGGRRVTARGETGEDGAYRLQSPEGHAGAIAGEHKIIVSPPAPQPGSTAAVAALDQKFQSYAKTPLSFTVKPAGPFEHNFEVHGPRGK
jgi:hypothetical protein